MSQELSSARPETGHRDNHGRDDQAHRPPGQAPVVERIAGWSVRHRKTAVLGWLAMVAVVFFAGQQIGTSNVKSYDPGQAGQAEQTLNRLHIGGQPPAESVLIQARGGGRAFAADPQLRRAARQVASALRGLPPSAASDIRSPLGPGGGPLVSADGRSALVTFHVTGTETSAVLPALRAVAALQASHPRLRIAEAGDASVNREANAQLSYYFRRAENTSLPVTLILLLAVFGALIAAGIPLLLAVTAVVTAILLSSVVGQWLPIGQSAAEVVLIIGMAVGVDYSLFYLRREREERARGRGTGEALRIAASTSGRAIVISGLTVMIALAGLFLTGYSEFTGIAVGAIAVVGVAVGGSLTALPALLSWLGSWAAGRTAAGSRSSAVAAPPPGRRSCGPRWSAGWCAVRPCGAASRRSRCSRWPRPLSACAWATRPIADSPPACPWCRP